MIHKLIAVSMFENLLDISNLIFYWFTDVSPKMSTCDTPCFGSQILYRNDAVNGNGLNR